MKAYNPKTAIANRLQGQKFSISSENDEKAMFEDMIRVASDAFAEYISDSDLKHDEYVKNLEDTAKEIYDIYLSKSLYDLDFVSLEYVRSLIKEQAEQQLGA